MSSQIANFATGVGSYDATIYNAQLDPSSNVGNADLSLNSASQAYMLSNKAFVLPAQVSGNGIGFSGWIFPTGSQAVNAVVFDISGNPPITLCCSGNILIATFNGQSTTATTGIVLNTWTFFCYTIFCNGTGANQMLYVGNNGVLTTYVNNIALYPATGTYTASSTLLGYGAGFNYFNGKMDDFRFYTRALTPPEIKVLWNYNYKSTSGNPIVPIAQPTFIGATLGAVYIDVSGMFSYVAVTRTQLTPTAATATFVISAASMYYNGTQWSLQDTTVAANASYSYQLTPYVLNYSGTVVTASGGYISGSTVVASSSSVAGSGNFTIATPITAGAVSTSNPVVPGWDTTTAVVTPTVASPASTSFVVANSASTGVYTSPLPSTSGGQYLMIAQSGQVGNVSTFTQSVSVTNTQGLVTFYAFPRDNSYNSLQTLTVTLGPVTLLNNFAFTQSTSPVPYTAFNLPFLFNVGGTYNLNFIFKSGTTALSSIGLTGVSVRTDNFVGVGYIACDASAMTVYYDFNQSAASGSSLADYATGSPVYDASFVNSASIGTVNPLTGNGYLTLTNPAAVGSGGQYLKIAPVTVPAGSATAGFSVCGWFCPSVVQPSAGNTFNSTIFCLNNGAGASIALQQYYGTNVLDFFVTGNDSIQLAYPITVNTWNMFAVCVSGNSATTATYTYYINNAQIGSVVGAYPTAGTYTNNTLGWGVQPDGGLFNGLIDEFRYYARALSPQDVFACWSYGMYSQQYSNVIDLAGLQVYYPMDQGQKKNYFASLIQNSYFQTLTTGSFPASTASLALTVPTQVSGWNYVDASAVVLCNGLVTGVYSGTLPSDISSTYLQFNLPTAAGRTATFSQTIVLLESGYYLKFYVLPTAGFNANITLSVALGGTYLASGVVPALVGNTTNPTYYAANSIFIPYWLAVPSGIKAGTYTLTFTFTNTAASATGVSVGLAGVTMPLIGAVRYNVTDPSFQRFYYSFDQGSYNGNAVANYANYGTKSALVVDASFIGYSNFIDTNYKIMGTSDLSLNGAGYLQTYKTTSFLIPAGSTTTGFTVIGWFYPIGTQASNACIICMNGTAGTTQNLAVYYNAAYKSLMFYANGASFAANTASPITPNTWNMFAMVVQGTGATTANFQCYLNNYLLNNGSITYPPVLDYSNVAIGNGTSGSTLDYFSGYVDEVRAYTRPLSGAEIRVIWTQPFTQSIYNLVDPTAMSVYYPMDSGTAL